MSAPESDAALAAQADAIYDAFVETDYRHNPARLATFIDHTLLSPDATPEQIDQLCAEALEHGFAAVCVRGPHVQRARRALAAPAADAGGPPSASPPPPRMAVACVVNFPAGTAGAADVLAEAGAALAAGATELDVVLDAAAMRAGRLAELLALLRELRRRADAGPATPAVLKLILETAALTPREAGAACALAARARWDFVKTSTGYAARGASLDDVRLMAAASRLAASACAAGPGTVAAPRVKASGGIRTWAQAVGMIDVGADRIGTSAGLAIMREARERAAAAAQD